MFLGLLDTRRIRAREAAAGTTSGARRNSRPKTRSCLKDHWWQKTIGSRPKTSLGVSGQETANLYFLFSCFMTLTLQTCRRFWLHRRPQRWRQQSPTHASKRFDPQKPQTQSPRPPEWRCSGLWSRSRNRRWFLKPRPKRLPPWPFEGLGKVRWPIGPPENTFRFFYLVSQAPPLLFCFQKI